MNQLLPNQNESYNSFLEELEESIIHFQKEVKAKGNDKRFNARAYLANQLGYKDERILYRFLDPNDISRAKIGLRDIELIILNTKDITPLENFIKDLKKKIQK